MIPALILAAVVVGIALLSKTTGGSRPELRHTGIDERLAQLAAQRPTCDRCGPRPEPGAQFCSRCGAALR